MLYYTMSQNEMQVLEVAEKCPDVEMKAKFFNCSVFILRGEHTGLSASFSRVDEAMATLSDEELEELVERVATRHCL